MPRYRIHGGNVTLNGRKHFDGEIIDFAGVPFVGFEPLDAEARSRKRESITDDVLGNLTRYPQRTMLLARSLGEDCSSPDRARRSIEEWMAEQRASAKLQ